jgi:hypothetical protein
LLLDVGVEESVNGTPRIAWGKKQTIQDVFIPLPLSLWINGTSHPTGRENVTEGNVDSEALRSAASIIF